MPSQQQPKEQLNVRELACPGLLRGITAAKLLAGRGAILAAPALSLTNPTLGDDDTYFMSRSLEHLDVFFSRSWRASRGRWWRRGSAGAGRAEPGAGGRDLGESRARSCGPFELQASRGLAVEAWA